MEHLGDKILYSVLTFTRQHTDAYLALQDNLLESTFIVFCEPFKWGNIADLGFGKVMNHRKHDASAKA
jgi:hypothetical protein